MQLNNYKCSKIIKIDDDRQACNPSFSIHYRALVGYDQKVPLYGRTILLQWILGGT